MPKNHVTLAVCFDSISDLRRRAARVASRSSCAHWILLLQLCMCATAVGSPPDLPEVRVELSQLKGIDLDGHLHRFVEGADCRGAAVVFLSTECPISNACIPTLSQLTQRYRRFGIKVFGVISDPEASRAEALRHREAFKIRFPVVFDASSELRRTLRPTHTPQAIVVSPQGETLYSGRIDNRFTELGQRREKASVHDLKNALASVVAGQKIEVPVTQPVGCLLEDPPALGKRGAVTFNRDVAPILFANCSECHRPEEAAPFSLLNYQDASRHAAQIAAVTKSRFMPPWHPVKGFGHFGNERRLTDAEIALIQQWVECGKPEGDSDDRLASPKFADGWRLGTPDLVLTMDEAFKLAADGPDVHQHFVLPTRLRKTRLVAALEFRPGNPRVVHHACFYVDTSGAAGKLAARSPDVGYGSFVGPGFVNVAALRSWLPGMSPQRLPKGAGQPLLAHSDLVLEIHYQRSGKPETDQSTVGIHFAASNSRQVVGEIQVMNKSLEIPAGNSRYRHHASYTLPVDATLLDTAPHMHLLGREMKATATLPDGKVEPLVWIKDWDFNWQGQYLYARPVRLPQGTRIDVDAWYDNSAKNPLNPHSPPQTVRWGEQTDDEMGVCHFRYTCDTMEQLRKLNTHYVRYGIEQQQRYERERASRN